MNDNWGWQGPGYQPGPPVPGLQRVAFDSRQGLETAAGPSGRRGSLLGLAIVVGLFAFFLADAEPGGLNAVATFFIAAGAVLVLFLVVAVVALIISRTRRPAPSPFAAGRGGAAGREGAAGGWGGGGGTIAPGPALASPWAQEWTAPAQGALGTPASTGAAAVEQEDPNPRALPGSRRHFLRVVDELLAAVDALPEDQGREVEADVLRFATSADPLDLVDLIERRRGVPAIRRFTILAEQLTGPQLRYLSVVLKARKVLR